MDLLLALGVPVILLVGATLLLAEGRLKMPSVLSKAGEHNAVFWNILVGVSIAVVAIKYALGK